METLVVKIKFKDSLNKTISEALESFGGIKSVVSPGDRVFLKPNLNTADIYPGSSDPAFIIAVGELCREAGAKEVLLAESSAYFVRTKSVLKKWGAGGIVENRPWLKVVNLDERKWVKKYNPRCKFLKNANISEIVDQADKIIFLPLCKTHILAQYTGALKLSVGLLRTINRFPMHARRLQEKIAEINSYIRCDLVIMDARKCFISKGPMTGPVREPGYILASKSRAAIDIEGVNIIKSYEGNSLSKVVAEELPQIKRALEMGID